MPIKTIPLSRLRANLEQTLDDCAKSGEAVVVELADSRLIVMQPLDPSADDNLTDELIRSNPAFRDMLAKSAAAPRKPFVPRT